MPSPFPGMNPYLEQEDAWHDFHESFMPRVRDLISVQADPRYIVKIDEHLSAVDIERLAFLAIRDRRNRQLVTLIELLSPANKRPGGDRDQYLAKRQEILASHPNKRPGLGNSCRNGPKMTNDEIYPRTKECRMTAVSRCSDP